MQLSFFDSLRKLFGGGKPNIRMPRRWPRILMTEPVSVMFNPSDRQSVMLKQLSAGGARIQSPNSLRSQTQVQLVLDFGAILHKTVDAEIMYCQRDAQGLHFNCGLRFLHIGHEGVPEIAFYIEEEQKRRKGTGQKWQG